MRWTVSLAVAAAIPLSAGAQLFEGAFVHPEGETVVLHQEGARVTGEVVVGGVRAALAGTVAGSRLTGRVSFPWGEALPFTAWIEPDGSLVVDVDGEVGRYRRVEAGDARPAPAPAGPPRAAPPRAAPGLAARSPESSAGPADPGGGRLYRARYEGWEVRIPRGWKAVERDGDLWLGSDTEAGLILVVHTPSRDPGRLQVELAAQLAEVGSFAPATLRPERGPAGPLYVAEVSGVAADGTRLAVRAVAAVGPRGSVGIMGGTTPERFPTLRRRVDSMARSVRFFEPEIARGARIVVGSWWSYSGTTSYDGGGGTTTTLSFCPDGRFYSSSSSSYYGSGADAGTGPWGVAGAGGSTGRWRAEGDERQGRIVVDYPDGTRTVIRYQVIEGGIAFDGRPYARQDGAGNCG